MAISLDATLIGVGGYAGDSQFWPLPSTITAAGYKSYEGVAGGEDVLTPGTPYYTFSEGQSILHFSSFEHGGADGQFPSALVNPRHDRVSFPFSLICGGQYTIAGGLDLPFGQGGNGDGTLIEFALRAPVGQRRIALRYTRWTDGFDPIHQYDDDGHSAALVLSGIASVTGYHNLPKSRMTSASTDPIRLVCDTPHEDNHVIDVLVAGRLGTSFTLEPMDEAQEPLFVHQPGNLVSGFATSDYFTGVASGAYFHYYASIRPRSGETTTVGWDFVTGAGNVGVHYAAVVVRPS